MMRKLFFLYMTFCVYVKKIYSHRTNFVFPEYPYKETNKNELAYREFESACEQSPTCAQLKGLHRVKCIRECISPSCYHHIYYSDQGHRRHRRCIIGPESAKFGVKWPLVE